jgi:hypothetical protein
MSEVAKIQHLDRFGRDMPRRPREAKETRCTDCHTSIMVYGYSLSMNLLCPECKKKRDKKSQGKPAWKRK